MGTVLSRLVCSRRIPLLLTALIRGEPAPGRLARRDLVFGSVHTGGTWTMKQSFASAAGLRGGGPILGSVRDQGCVRVSAPSDHDRRPLRSVRRMPSSFGLPIRPTLFAA